jgi:hypothetical protein
MGIAVGWGRKWVGLLFSYWELKVDSVWHGDSITDMQVLLRQ